MQRSGRITDEERRLALERLRSSREKFTSAIAGVSANQARFKPSADRWSILELAEHIAISDESLRALIRRALDSPAQPELMEQVQANDFRYHRPFRPHPRGVNQAPENMRPHGRFATLEDAAAEFHRQRDQTLAYAAGTQDELRHHMFLHPVFGPMDAYQWLMACSIHVESHSHQMEELKQDPGYPAR